jgi:putative phosphoribosyl transferase
VTHRSVDLAPSQPPFRNRADAGRVLAYSLGHYASDPGVVVLGLARGGMPVAREVATAMGVTLGVLAARRIGVPGIEEVALGAIAEGNRRFVADAVSRYIGVPSDLVERLTAGERVELERRASLYHAGQPLPDLEGRTVVLVDDGLVTGSTLRAAARAVRDARPKRVVAAVPVATRWGASEVRAEVDELLVLVTPARFEVVARSYADYPAVSDDDVLALLGGRIRRVSWTVRDISERLGAAFGGADARARDHERTIAIPVADGVVAGDLGVPAPGMFRGVSQRSRGVRGLAILANAGGSSRNNFRKRYIAGRLRLGGFATLRLDLLTSEEQRAGVDGAPVGHDLEREVERLAARLASVCGWVADASIAGAHRTVLVGSGLGAAVALVTAARRPDWIWSVIARAGRVDLAAHASGQVCAPVLLVVGATDRETLTANAHALRKFPRGAQLVTVPHAGHGFEEPGALGAVGEHVIGWLDRLEGAASGRSAEKRKRQ